MRLLSLGWRLGLVDGFKIFEDINQEGFLILNICFVGVANEVHVELSPESLLPIFDLLRGIEGLLFLELVEVLSTNFRADVWDVRGFLRLYIGPIIALEERVGLNFINTIFPQSVLWLTYHFLKNICGSEGKIGFLRNDECFPPVENLLASD